MKQKWIHRMVAASLSILLLSAFTGCAEHAHSYQQNIIEPTCITIGYTVNTCSCGDVFYSDYQAEIPHSYSDWIVSKEATSIYGGEEYCFCSVCGKVITRDTENLSELPEIYLTSSDQEGAMEFQYSSSSMRFSCEAILSVTGQKLGKNSYSVQLQNEDGEAYEIDLGCGMQSRFLLLSDAIDSTKSRYQTTASLLSDFYSDTSYTSIYTAQNSFSVQLFSNGVYQGVFTMASMPDFSQYTVFASYLQTDTSTSCLFQGNLHIYNPESDTSVTGFQLVDCTDIESGDLEKSFRDFYEFIVNSKDETFRKHLSQYTDVSVLIDFFLSCEVLYIEDCGESGLIWYTTDGQHWLPDYSSLDTSIGMMSAGYKVGSEYRMPGSDGEGHLVYTGNHLLWKRLSELFSDEISERYHEIREIFDYETVSNAFLTVYQKLDEELLKEETILYPETKLTADADSLLTFIQERIEKLDQRTAS